LKIKAPVKELIEEIANPLRRPGTYGIIESGDKEQLADYLWGRDTLDLLLQFPVCEFTAAEFIALLKTLQTSGLFDFFERQAVSGCRDLTCQCAL